LGYLARDRFRAASSAPARSSGRQRPLLPGGGMATALSQPPKPEDPATLAATRDQCLRAAGPEAPLAPEGFAYADLLRSELSARITEWQHTILEEVRSVSSEHSQLTSTMAATKAELASLRAAAEDTRRIFSSRVADLEARLAAALDGNGSKVAADSPPAAGENSAGPADAEELRQRIERDSNAVIRSTAALQRSLLARSGAGGGAKGDDHISTAFFDILRLADDIRRQQGSECKPPCACAEASDHSVDSTPEVAGRRPTRRGSEPRPLPPPMRSESLSALGPVHRDSADQPESPPRMRRSPRGSAAFISLPRMDDEPEAPTSPSSGVSPHDGEDPAPVPEPQASANVAPSPHRAHCVQGADGAAPEKARSHGGGGRSESAVGGSSPGASRSLASSAREVSFRLNCPHTRHGLHVRVVGSCGAFGAWNPRQGHVLITSPAEFPMWRSQEPLVLEDCPAMIEYKYIICNGDASYVLWESGENRHINLAEVSPRQARVTVTETYDKVNDCVTERIRCASHSLLPREGEEDDDDDDLESNWSSLVREESYSQMHSVMQDIDSEVADRPEVMVGPEFERRYRLLGRGPLGEGTFGLVWSCQALDAARSSQELAAKIIRKSTLQPRDAEHLLGEFGEVRTHISLKHSHIVNLHEYFDESHTVTLVLECCRGGDLFDALNREWPRTGRGFLEPAAVRVMTHILSALEHIHGRHIVHRDLKCENVLLSMSNVAAERNTFKLCDFGFSAYDDGSHTLTARVGSPYTVAPEVVAGKPYGSPVDMWSIGVVMYMTLAAQSPFYAPSNSRVLRLVLNGSYSLQNGIWPSVSPPAKALLTSLMTVDPAARVTARQALEYQWLSTAAGAPH